MRAFVRKWLLPGQYERGYIPVADGFRVLCVLIVAWFHIWQQSWLTPELTLGPIHIDLLPLVRTGYLMVDMMLLLSGFLLFLPYARARVDGGPLPDVATFYKKRVVRIVPAYYFCVFVILFAQALPTHAYGNWRHFVLDLLGHLTFTHNLTYEGYIGSHLNGVLWTMAVEGQFYLILPLLGRAFVRKPLLTYAGMVGTALVYRFVYVAGLQNTSLYFNRLPAMLDVYANGMAFAWLCAAIGKRVKQPGCLVSLGSLALSLLAVYAIWRIAREQATRFDGELIRMGQMLHRFPLSVCGGVILVCGTLMPRFCQALMGNRLTKFLSAVSFNYYMWHSTVALWLRGHHIPPYTDEMPQRAAEQPWQTLYTYLCFFAALVVATAITYTIEKPCARWGTELLLKKGKHDR